MTALQLDYNKLLNERDKLEETKRSNRVNEKTNRRAANARMVKSIGGAVKDVVSTGTSIAKLFI